MWTGAKRRSQTRALGGVLLVLAMAACGRSVRDDSASEGAAGDESGGTGGTVGGSSSGSDTGGRGGASGSESSTGGRAGAPGGSAGSGGESARGGAGGEGGVFECVLAMRVGCCPGYLAVSRAELDADECLIEYGYGPPPPEFVASCITTPACPTCEVNDLPSRRVEPDENGGCRFADECETADDCQVARDCCSCCACPEPSPRSFVGFLSCFVPTDDPPEPNDIPANMCQVCAGAICAACKPRDGLVSCNPTPRGPRRCEWGPPLDSRHCNAERPCVDLAPGQMMRCYAPGDTYCGGPAPPPDECAVDDDCRTMEGREHYLCAPTGHCGMLRCEPGCLTDVDCSIAEVCGADHRCAPKPCESEICGGNHVCPSGLCQRRTCTTSEQCSGHCINGYCHEEPGLCSDRAAP